MAKFLTFDLGTTLYKVALFDDSGHLLGLERVAPPIEQPQPGWAVVDPDRFLNSLIDATQKLKTGTGGDWSDVAAVSFATQANTFTLLDKEGDPTIPLILWTDRRAASLTPELDQITALPQFRHHTGLPRFGPALALAKVLWLRRNDPKQLQSHAGPTRFCFISDYLTSVISGRKEDNTEAGVAGLSGAMDITSLEWSDEILRRVELPPIRMPRVNRAGTDLGLVNEFWSESFGLPPTCRFVIGCLDRYAGAIGTGTLAPGNICETTGTVLAAVRCSDTIQTDLPPDVFHGPAFDPGLFFQMSFSSTSANLLEWYRNTLPNRPEFAELSRQAESATDAPTIEPYREGEPIETCFRNVRPHHSVGQIVRGIMQRVADSLKAQVSSLCGATPPTEIHSAGGGARSDLWLQIKADTLGIPFVALECEEPTSLGAAMLAARALGMGDLPSLATKWIKVRRRFEPRSGHSV